MPQSRHLLALRACLGGNKPNAPILSHPPSPPEHRQPPSGPAHQPLQVVSLIRVAIYTLMLLMHRQSLEPHKYWLDAVCQGTKQRCKTELDWMYCATVSSPSGLCHKSESCWTLSTGSVFPPITQRREYVTRQLTNNSHAIDPHETDRHALTDRQTDKQRTN